MKRLHELGLQALSLPLGTTADDKHIPILVSPDIAGKKHIIVYIGERHNDLGILAYRIIGEEGLNSGSIVNFAKSVLHASNIPDTPAAEQPGLIIANPGQLIWYRGGGRAVSDREWMYLPRESAVHDAMRIDDDKNYIEGNKDYRQHVQYIFQNLLSPGQNGTSSICHPDAKITIIGQEFPGSAALQCVVNNWSKWQNRLSSIAIINPQHSLDEILSNLDDSTDAGQLEYDQIVNFIAHRTRAYRLDHRPLETVISGRDELGCNVYSSGESLYDESCFIRCWPSILDWITLCRINTNYQEKLLEPKELDGDDHQGEKHRYTSPRKIQDDDLAKEVRFHGELDDLKVIEVGSVEQ